MSLGSEPNYMDKLKTKNTPAALRQQQETPQVPMVKISTEETEEERKERQAQNAAVAAGLALGTATALIQHALQKDEPIEVDPNDDEGWGFNLSM